MRQLALCGIVVSGLLSTAARRADAECNAPTWVGAAQVTHIPTHGTLYVHDETLAWADDTDELTLQMRPAVGGLGSLRIRRVERTVAAIDYTGAGGGVSFRDGFDELTDLVDDGHWAPPTAAPRVLQFWHHESEWTCSSADSLMIQLDQPVAAVRVRWTVGGHAVDYIEVPRIDGTKTVLELGKIDCGSANIPVEQLHDGGGIDLFAIRFDGSEVAITGMPSHVSLADIEPTDAGIDHAFTIVATQEPRAATLKPPVTARDDEDGPMLGVIVMLLAAFGAVGGLWLIRRLDAAQLR